MCYDIRGKSLRPRHACMAVERRLIAPPKHSEKVGQGPHDFRMFCRIVGARSAEQSVWCLLTSTSTVSHKHQYQETELLWTINFINSQHETTDIPDGWKPVPLSYASFHYPPFAWYIHLSSAVHWASYLRCSRAAAKYSSLTVQRPDLL